MSSPSDEDNSIPKQTIEPNKAPNEKQATTNITTTTKFTPTREFRLAFISLCAITAAVAFEATSLSVALPLISTELGGTALEAFWSGTGYLLSSTVLKPSIASLSGIFGRKYVSFLYCVWISEGVGVLTLQRRQYTPRGFCSLPGRLSAGWLGTLLLFLLDGRFRGLEGVDLMLWAR